MESSNSNCNKLNLGLFNRTLRFFLNLIVRNRKRKITLKISEGFREEWGGGSG